MPRSGSPRPGELAAQPGKHGFFWKEAQRINLLLIPVRLPGGRGVALSRAENSRENRCTWSSDLVGDPAGHSTCGESEQYGRLHDDSRRWALQRATDSAFRPSLPSIDMDLVLSRWRADQNFSSVHAAASSKSRRLSFWPSGTSSRRRRATSMALFIRPGCRCCHFVRFQPSRYPVRADLSTAAKAVGAGRRRILEPTRPSACSIAQRAALQNTHGAE